MIQACLKRKKGAQTVNQAMYYMDIVGAIILKYYSLDPVDFHCDYYLPILFVIM